jgi:hypothetical protein
LCFCGALAPLVCVSFRSREGVSSLRLDDFSSECPLTLPRILLLAWLAVVAPRPGFVAFVDGVSKIDLALRPSTPKL